jgi:release factor glutamine methyltransferase
VRLLAVPGVFRPRSDSWLLAALVAREPLAPGARVLDLCAGSGVLAITAARRDGVSAVAVDVSRRAVVAIRANAWLNGVVVDARRGDLFDAVAGERFDLIVSNPPYVPGATDELPTRGPSRAWEGGVSGRRFIDRLCAGAADHLAPGGVILLVHSSVCGEARTLEALTDRGLAADVVARNAGRLGPLMRSRADLLVRRRLLSDPSAEELLVFRASESSVDACVTQPCRPRPKLAAGNPR